MAIFPRKPVFGGKEGPAEVGVGDEARLDAAEAGAASGPEPARCRGDSVAGFSIAASAVQGPGHIREGAPCDDRFAWQSEDGRICAIVSDGAGSAALGRIGAEQASKLLSSDVLRAMRGADLSVEGVRGALLASVVGLRRALVAAYPEAKLSDFHATVVGAIWETTSGVLFHIGDGIAASLSPKTLQLDDAGVWANAQISEPENGEYSDQTYFFTMEPVSVRLMALNEPSAIVLMTDGGAGIAYTNHTRKLEEASSGRLRSIGREFQTPPG